MAIEDLNIVTMCGDWFLSSSRLFHLLKYLMTLKPGAKGSDTLGHIRNALRYRSPYDFVFD